MNYNYYIYIVRSQVNASSMPGINAKLNFYSGKKSLIGSKINCTNSQSFGPINCPNSFMVVSLQHGFGCIANHVIWICGYGMAKT